MALELSQVETLLRSLMRGEFSSLHITFNDLHAPNYMTAQQWAAENPPFGDYNNLEDWISPQERDKAIAGNSVWAAQWYPDTPVGFCFLYASSLEALIQGLDKLGDEPAENRSV